MVRRGVAGFGWGLGVLPVFVADSCIPLLGVGWTEWRFGSRFFFFLGLNLLQAFLQHPWPGMDPKISRLFTLR